MAKRSESSFWRFSLADALAATRSYHATLRVIDGGPKRPRIKSSMVTNMTSLCSGEATVAPSVCFEKRFIDKS